MSKAKIPVILDTDIGDDIDDTWALAMMLKCPELDVKMVSADYGDTHYRGRIIGKLLEVAQRTDVDVALGLRQREETKGRQAAWIEGYDLDSYPGTVHENGVDALVRTIMDAKDPITLISIGPTPTIAAALKQEPAIASRARFVGMHGSIRRGHLLNTAVVAEWNVKADTPSFQAVISAPWQSITLTPLDTCGQVMLTGTEYRHVLKCKEPLMKAVIENYRAWAPGSGHDPEKASSILFDTVAVHLAFSREYLAMERLGLHVTDDGFTVIDPDGPEVDAAVDWKDLDKYHAYLAEILTR